MIKEIIATGVDANAAIESGALLLGLPREEVQFEIIDLPLPAAVIGGVDIGVKIGSEKDGEFFTFHSYPRASRTRILAEMASMMSTRMISPSRMAPTSFQR